MRDLYRFRRWSAGGIVAIWATIWATYGTARLVGLRPDGPADHSAGLLDAANGLARCLVALRWRRAVRPSRAALRRPGCRSCTNEPTTFFARWELWLWRRRARLAARRVLCAAARVALCARFGVPGAVRFARFAVPDGALFPTSARLWTASWAWRAPRWFELLLAIPSEL